MELSILDLFLFGFFTKKCYICKCEYKTYTKMTYFEFTKRFPDLTTETVMLHF